jgi:methionyl-tRNA synthetase
VKTYVTTPIYYPNDVPHIGTAYPTVAADVIARWSRLCGRESFFLTGTDEHGKKIENAALKRGITPRQLVDELSTAFVSSFEELDIAYDRFIRTTDEDHIRVVREILQRCWERGDIYKGVYEGLYCVECEAYYSTGDLKNTCCPQHLKPVELLREDCYYFRLSNYRDWLLQYYEEHPNFILPPSRHREVVSFVLSGLDDLCISRSSFNWGIPFPFDRDHVTYVWFDALLNYITGIGFLDQPIQFQEFWPDVTHIIGKDILRFHAVIWPAILKSAGISAPKRIFAHGFWMINGQKFSKSLGNSIRPNYLIARYGLDPLRYYLFRECPFGEDGNFSEANLVRRNNDDLAKGLGNLVQRVITMIVKYREGIVPVSWLGEELELEVEKAAELVVIEVSAALENLTLNKALEAVWGYVTRLNIYANARQPWILAKHGHDELLDTTLAHLAEGLRFLSTLVAPFMPTTGTAIAGRVGLEDVPQIAALIWGNTLAKKRVEDGPALFKMLDAPVEHGSELSPTKSQFSSPGSSITG